VAAWSQVQHDMPQEPQTSQAGQDGFEQHLAEARQAEPAPVGGRGSYPHLFTEDRDLIRRLLNIWIRRTHSRIRSSFILRHFVDWRMISGPVAKRLI
jgi:hypothetical protein